MARSSPVIDYRGRFTFAAPPEAIWRSIEHCERFEGWWAWLREFRLVGPGLEAGAVLRGVVSPPVPYTMRVEVVLDRCVRPTAIDATVHGDLEGEARLRIEPDGAGAAIEVAWTVEMMQRPMRVASRVAHPLLRFGHDRVVEATVIGFRRNLDREIRSQARAGEDEGN